MDINIAYGGIIPHSRSTDYQSVTDTGTPVSWHDRRDVRSVQIADSIENRPLSLDSLITPSRALATAQKVLICRMVLNQRGRGDADMAAVCAVRLYHKNMTFALPFRQSALQATSQERQVAA